MIYVFFALTVIISNFSYSLDEVFVKNVVEKIKWDKKMWTDPIASQAQLLKSTDKEIIAAYLLAARILLCELLAADPLRQPKNFMSYDYQFDIEKFKPFTATYKAGIQVLPDNKFMFFLMFKENKSCYLYYKDILYYYTPSYTTPSVSDLAVSLDSEFICGIDNFWKIKIFSTPNAELKSSNAIFNGLQIYDYPYLDQKIQEETEDVEVLTKSQVSNTSIICTKDNWYCSANNKVYEFQVDKNSRKALNIKQVLQFGEEFDLTTAIYKLAACDDILIVNLLDNKVQKVYFFDTKQRDNRGYLKEIAIPVESRLNIEHIARDYIILVDVKKNTLNQVDIINTYDVLKQRQLNYPEGHEIKGSERYIAIDISTQENRIAFLPNKNPRVDVKATGKFVPTLLYTDLIPVTLKPIIDAFNRAVDSTITKDEAKTFLEDVVNQFNNPTRPVTIRRIPQVQSTIQQPPQIQSKSLWQRLYQKVKDNIAWIGVGVTVSLVGIGAYLFKKNSPTPTAWNTVISRTPKAVPSR